MAEHAVKPLSVLMIAHNAEAYVEEAIESIRRQSFSNFAFIVVNDCSTDRTSVILDGYASKDDRIQVIHRSEQGGVAAARNEGLVHADEPFVAMMDADDIAPPRRLEEGLSFLRDHPEHVAVGGEVLLIDPDGAPIGRWDAIRLSHEEIVTALLEKTCAVHHGAAVIRREALATIGGYREQFWTGSDHDVMLRLSEIGRLANLSHIMLKYRQHFSSLVHRNDIDTKRENLTIMVQEALDRRGLDESDVVGDAFQGGVLLPPEGHEDTYFHYKWASKALRAGYFKAARKHYAAVLRKAPVYALRRFAHNMYRTAGKLLQGS